MDKPQKGEKGKMKKNKIVILVILLLLLLIAGGCNSENATDESIRSMETVKVFL